MTKTDIARVIVQALYNLPKLPAADNPNVVGQTRKRKAELERMYPQAVRLNARRAIKAWRAENAA